MSRLMRWSIVVAAGVVAAAVLFPAAADWLVTRDGSQLETVGPWKVQNRLVVFKRPNGTFASLRLSDVDLDASKALSREMVERAARPPKPQQAKERKTRKPVLRLTEKDLPAQQAEPQNEGETAEKEKKPDEKSKAQSALRVANWREVATGAGEALSFTGTVENGSSRTALGVGLTVTLLDEAGEEIGKEEAVLTSKSLSPGASAGFRVSFPNVLHYAQADFHLRGDLVLTNRPAPSDQGPSSASAQRYSGYPPRSCCRMRRSSVR